MFKIREISNKSPNVISRDLVWLIGLEGYVWRFIGVRFLSHLFRYIALRITVSKPTEKPDQTCIGIM